MGCSSQFKYTDKNGYLQSELRYCKDRKYLIGAKVASEGIH